MQNGLTWIVFKKGILKDSNGTFIGTSKILALEDKLEKYATEREKAGSRLLLIGTEGLQANGEIVKDMELVMCYDSTDSNSNQQFLNNNQCAYVVITECEESKTFQDEDWGRHKLYGT